MVEDAPTISVVIPTYGREAVLLETIGCVLELSVPPNQVIVVDQTEVHAPATEEVLGRLDHRGAIRWLRIYPPSIPRAMNLGLLEASSDVVLFLDDDVIPHEGLIEAHQQAHRSSGYRVVVGQILQPGEEPASEGHQPDRTSFHSTVGAEVHDVMAGNLSVDRRLALQIGGFDENFKRAAFRFESEFADRLTAAGHRILFEPSASLRHLREQTGGTRIWGEHFRTLDPGHAVGAYYYLLGSPDHRLGAILRRMVSSVSTRHHLSKPWWIPGTVFAEVIGLFWALLLRLRGARTLSRGPGR